MSHSQEHNIEKRFFTAPETRAKVINEETRTIRGYGVVFNSESAILYERGRRFREIIRPEAVNSVTSKRRLCMHNHKSDRLLGNTNAGTMRTGTDAIGEWYETDLPNSPTGEDVFQSVKRGDTEGSSFQFTVAEGGEKWSIRDGMAYREITKFAEIYEMGPVSEPAYPATASAGLSARSLEMLFMIKIEDKEEKEDPEEIEEMEPENDMARSLINDREIEAIQMMIL
jgi:HK97 family phage prohead protease